MTSNAPRADAVRVAVFAKAPVPGAVKTRLTALLGETGAAALHASLVRRALATAAASAVGPVELWCSPDEGHEFFAGCAAQFGATLHRQQGRDLGERMRGAFEAGFARGGRLVLIGADCPSLQASDLRAAAEAIAACDVALAPAEDGGYVLIAMSRPVAGLFDGVRWGGAAVMGETRERLRAAGASWRELPERWDVDRPEDYARLAREGLLQEVLP